MLRDQVDCTTGALFDADAAALAVVILELVFTRLDFGDGVIGTDAEAVVAAEAVAA